MKDEDTTMIDGFLRAKVEALGYSCRTVEPSKQFQSKVMREIVRCELERAKRRMLFVAFAALTPFIVRAIWSLLRHDYVAVSQLPLGSYIISIYHVFLLPITMYALLILGISVSGLVLWRGWHRLSSSVSRTRMAF